MALGARGATAQSLLNTEALPRSPSFKVMTWNIQGKYVPLPVVGGTESITDLIKQHDPDIIGFQEIWEAQAHAIAYRLGWRDLRATLRHVYWIRVNSTLEGMAILSRYPLSHKDSWRLPDAAEDHGRYLMRATTKVRGRTLHVYNTHLTNKLPEEREEQTREVLAHIDGDRLAARGSFRPVLTGDMNATAREPAYRLLATALTDAWTAEGRNPKATTPDCVVDRPEDIAGPSSQCGHTNPVRKEPDLPDPRFKEATPHARIDYVFLDERDGEPVADVMVPRRNVRVGPRSLWRLSDHLPVIATMVERPNPSARVVYRGTDRHIYQLLLPPGREWVWSDLTEVTGARGAASDPAVYLTGHREVRIVYRGTDDHVHELFQDVKGGWRHVDLHNLAGVAAVSDASVRGNPAGYASPQPRVVFRGRDNHVHELFQNEQGDWVHADLHRLANAARLSGVAVEGDPTGYASPAPRVVYRGNNNHVHEFFQHPDGRWVHADLNTLAAGAVRVRGNPAGYASPSGARVVYRSSDQHLHELFQRPQDGVWVHADLHRLALGAEADAFRAAGDPDGFAAPLARVSFRDPRGRAQQFVQEPDGDWVHADLHGAAGGPRPADSGVSGYATPFFSDQLRVVYRNGGHVHELFQQPGGQWGHVDLTRLTDAPDAAGDPVGLASRPPPPSIRIAEYLDEPVASDDEVFFETTILLKEAGGFRLSGSQDGTGSWYVDDAVNVTVRRADGTVKTRSIDFNRGGDCSGIVEHGPVDLAELLGPGLNEVTIAFRDVCGGNKGNTDLWLQGEVLPIGSE